MGFCNIYAGRVINDKSNIFSIVAVTDLLIVKNNRKMKKTCSYSSFQC